MGCRDPARPPALLPRDRRSSSQLFAAVAMAAPPGAAAVRGGPGRRDPCAPCPAAAGGRPRWAPLAAVVAAVAAVLGLAGLPSACAAAVAPTQGLMTTVVFAQPDPSTFSTTVPSLRLVETRDVAPAGSSDADEAAMLAAAPPLAPLWLREADTAHVQVHGILHDAAASSDAPAPRAARRSANDAPTASSAADAADAAVVADAAAKDADTPAAPASTTAFVVANDRWFASLLPSGVVKWNNTVAASTTIHYAVRYGAYLATITGPSGQATAVSASTPVTPPAAAANTHGGGDDAADTLLPSGQLVLSTWDLETGAQMLGTALPATTLSASGATGTSPSGEIPLQIVFGDRSDLMVVHSTRLTRVDAATGRIAWSITTGQWPTVLGQFSPRRVVATAKRLVWVGSFDQTASLATQTRTLRPRPPLPPAQQMRELAWVAISHTGQLLSLHHSAALTMPAGTLNDVVDRAVVAGGLDDRLLALVAFDAVYVARIGRLDADLLPLSVMLDRPDTAALARVTAPSGPKTLTRLADETHYLEPFVLQTQRDGRQFRVTCTAPPGDAAARPGTPAATPCRLLPYAAVGPAPTAQRPRHTLPIVVDHPFAEDPLLLPRLSFQPLAIHLHGLHHGRLVDARRLGGTGPALTTLEGHAAGDVTYDTDRLTADMVASVYIDLRLDDDASDAPASALAASAPASASSASLSPSAASFATPPGRTTLHAALLIATTDGRLLRWQWQRRDLVSLVRVRAASDAARVDVMAVRLARSPVASRGSASEGDANGNNAVDHGAPSQRVIAHDHATVRLFFDRHETHGAQTHHYPHLGMTVHHPAKTVVKHGLFSPKSGTTEIHHGSPVVEFHPPPSAVYHPPPMVVYHAPASGDHPFLRDTSPKVVIPPHTTYIHHSHDDDHPPVGGVHHIIYHK
ncbi:hypothetical protein CXG81DRAFT_20910 [Caulochytrium protostelioides]|uniref:Uncharacterized protein n=1 Tax=Caulochytrium protostelioides TaxID=1555241 RepID=A0A4P9WZG1_9FUNG|nr:hypothetical protein CXG81DRAFT_20910 [Caulochytrium protostelioides]|eukprot:RKO98949.1 hypothetical protein CXG81DRAFT_20910 [Caulochytrium protostelioides]